MSELMENVREAMGGIFGCDARAGNAAGIQHSVPGRCRLKPITSRTLCRLLETNGWSLQRIAGSHHIYTKPVERKVLSVPVHANRELKPGMIAIMLPARL